MGLFSRGIETKSKASQQAAAAKNTAQRRGRNTVTLAEVQCRSRKRTGRPIFGATFKSK